MRIFVTGASGFIGRRLLDLLRGHEVLCLSRSANQLSAGVLCGDLVQPETWEPELTRFAPDWCVHLAWQGLPDYSIACCRVNLAASLRLLETLVRARVRRIVVAGSCWEYGAASGAVTESLHPDDCGVFAATKLALNGILASASRDAGFEYRWARIFFLYGPGQRTTSLIPSCRAAFVAGSQPEIRQPRVVQDFVHIDDAARGLAALTECDAASGIYNLGSGRPTAVADVTNLVAAHYGARPPYTDTTHESGFWADMAKTTAATGWTAGITIQDGVAQTLRTLDNAA